MGTALSTVIAEKAAELTSWPNWLDTRVSCISGQYRDAPLPMAQLLTEQQLSWAQNQINCLEAALQEKSQNNQALGLLAEFIMTYAPNTLTEAQAMAKAQSFSVAIEDMPTWAVAQAIRNWHQGKVLSDVNYSFPVPAMLRDACLDVLKVTEGRKSVLERIVSASDIQPVPEGPRAEMGERMKKLFAETAEAVSV